MALTFNDTYYLSNNADVLAAVGRGTFATASQHYSLFGARELRNPNSTFNAREYVLQNDDLVRAFQNGTLLNPFQHYLTFGVTENRAPNAALFGFDSARYLSTHADVAAAVGTGKAFSSAMQHYLLFGATEGRAAQKTDGTAITGLSTGSTFTLTTNPDNITGTSGNDTINGYLGTATTATLSAADVINGGAGTDTMVLTADNNAAGALPAATITGVEVFSIRETGGTAGSYDFASVNGETSVINRTSTDAVSFLNLAAGTSLTLQGDGTTTMGATTFTMASATTAAAIVVDGVGTSGTPNLTRNATGAAAITITTTGSTANTLGTIDLDTGTALTGLTINAASNLTASLDANDYAANSTLTLKGSATINLSGAALAANITTVDGSAMTAGGFNVTTGVANASVTGGAGNDTIGIGNLVNTSATVSGGAGTDVISLSDAAALTAAIGARFTNFEILRITDDGDDGGDAFTVSQITGITGLQLAAISTNDAVTLNSVSATQAGAVTILGSQAAAPVINVTNATNVGQLDTLTINVNDDSSTKNTITLADLTAAGVETFNISMTDNTTFTAMTGLTALTSMTLTGAGNASLTTGALAINVNSVIDGSAMTGTLTFVGTAATTNGLKVTGGAGNDTITGTPQADAILGGAGNDSITAGNGIDTITSGAGRDRIIVDATATANRDVVTDFTVGIGGDALTFGTAYLKANNTAVTAGDLATTSVVTVGTSGNLTGAAGQFVFLITVENVSGSLSTNGDSVLNALVTGAGSGTITLANAADTLVFLVSNGTDVGVYYAVGGGDTAVANTEINLVATLSGVSLASLVGGTNGNFVVV
ncbi:MAG: hemolysin-type calcium-binding region [Alphaproteobacteria bacterium]|nr:MAG: hemolysin-type calcium-binding region [Alphaproteobacteria bacterium]